MNAIEIDFLNEIESKSGFAQSELLRVKLATELAGKMELFMEWSHRNYIWDRFYELYMLRNEGRYEKYFKTISDLYQYFLDNIDGK